MSLFNPTVRLALLLATLLPFAIAQAQDRAGAEQELAAVNTAIVDIQSWLDGANASHSEALTRLRAIELEIDEVHSRIDAVESALEETQARLDALTAEQQTLTAARDRQQETLAAILRATYMTGNEPVLKLLLNQQDPSAAARMLHYARVLSEEQLTRVQAYQATLAELETVDNELTASLAQLGEQRAALESEATSLDSARGERERVLATLSGDISGRREELQQLELDRAELQALLEEIARAMEGVRSFADVPPFAEQRGQLPAPTDGVVSSRFGAAYGGGSLNRQGIILRASEGTPVRAVHAGRVVFADWLRGAGLLAIVDHGDGYMSLYAGNEALGVTAGDWVDRGQVLATSGPGVAGGEAGLYFEIRQQGRAVDPADWLTE